MADKLKKLKVRLSSRNSIEPEEIFFDGSKLREFKESETNTGKLESPISSFVFGGVNLAQIIALVGLFAYTAFLIIGKGEHYSLQATLNASRTFPVYAPRGAILSSDGVVLAENKVYFDIVIKGSEVLADDGELASIAKVLSPHLFLSEESILNKFQSARDGRFSELVLKNGVRSEDMLNIDDYIGNIEFIEIRESFRRYYPYGSYFAHAIGYTGEVSEADISISDYIPGERIGKMGAEAFYDTALRGRTGIFVKRVDSWGEIFENELGRSPEAGMDIILNINYELQRKVRDILERHTKSLDISSGAVIIMDPKDGSILAFVNTPSFNPNLFEEGISRDDFDNLIHNASRPLFNRAISGEYPSGSTIKPIIAAAALEEEIVTPDFLIYSDGALEVPSVYNPDVVYEFKDWKAHGWTDIRRAIADSVNIYFYTIGGGYEDVEGLGIKNIEEYLYKFGWGRTLGIDLPSERGGLIPNPKWKKEVKGENWYIGDTYNVSIGQGDILTTPLQIAAATAVFANGGTLFSPKIAKSINGEDILPEVIKDGIISKQNLEIVREGMRRAVETGSSKYLAALPIQAAGKTGTAQTGRGDNHAWFTGFAPFEDPEIVITVLIEEGGKSDYAVRAARDIINAYLDIYPES